MYNKKYAENLIYMVISPKKQFLIIEYKRTEMRFVFVWNAYNENNIKHSKRGSVKMYPNPIKRREYAMLSDGWEFSLDKENWQPICVPYCPQSSLSGIADTGPIEHCFYRKRFARPWKAERTVLHFGAVDYRAVVTVNGRYVGTHEGGYTPFEFDISRLLQEENYLEVEVYDENQNVPFGKQTYKGKSFGCFYTRTTGIWQPVWLERTGRQYIEDFYFYPDVEKCAVDIDLHTSGKGSYAVTVSFDGREVGKSTGNIIHREKIHIPLSEKHLWQLGDGALYDVQLRFEEDRVESYFGLRTTEYRGMDFLINGQPVFQRLVMDQGFYPEGIYTPPSMEMVRQDIQRGKRLGFNGARLHEKVFDPQSLYEYDKAGYMVWGEFPSWGIDYSKLDGLGTLLAQWQEAVKRDFNHPAIILWCPLNEVWGAWDDPTKLPDIRFVDAVYAVTKQMDTTRPCVDVSGGYHGKQTDLYDFHSYGSAEELKTYIRQWQEKGVLDVPLLNCPGLSTPYREGQPVNVSEYGGISLGECAGDEAGVCAVTEGAVQSETDWGYGENASDGDAFVERYRKLTQLLLGTPGLSGYCYTQLYDIEQETNGFYYYDRSDKLTEEQKDAIYAIQCGL